MFGKIILIATLALIAWAALARASHGAGPEQRYTVRPGDTLYGVLVSAGITEDDANNAVGAIAEIFSPRDLRAGQEITLNITTASGTRESAADAQLMGLSFEPNVTTDVTLTRNDLTLFNQPIAQRVLGGGTYTTTARALLVDAITKSDNTANDALVRAV